MKPDTTVLMVVRNEERFIGQAIKSILDQTYEDHVFFIVDDGSMDTTWKVVKSFDDARIKATRFASQEYLTKRLNWELSRVRTEFVARMDSHNICSPDRLEKQRNFMLEHEEIALVGSNYIKIDESGREIFRSNFPLTWPEIKASVLKKNPFKHASWFARYDVLKREGFYNESFRFAQDYEFLLRLVPKYPVANLPDRLLTEIKIKEAVSQRHRSEQALLALKAQLLALTKYHYPSWQAVYLLRSVSFYLKSLIFK